VRCSPPPATIASTVSPGATSSDFCRANAIAIHLGAFDLDRAHAADEAFVTGTLGGMTPVRQIDGHVLAASPGAVTLRLTALYEALKDAEAARSEPW